MACLARVDCRCCLGQSRAGLWTDLNNGQSNVRHCNGGTRVVCTGQDPETEGRRRRTHGRRWFFFGGGVGGGWDFRGCGDPRAAGTVFVDVLVMVFGPGTTAVEAMPDSAMVKRALGARVNVAGPCDEGEEPAVGDFSSSGVVASVVAGIGKMAGPACWMLGLAFIRKDFFGWAAVMPR